MPALIGDEAEPDEQTREYAQVERDARADTMVVPPDAIPEELAAADAAAQPATDARRVRLVLIALVVLVVAAALVIWWLSR
jgi:ferric-dicitrate binding protein FerR (iron transport regulator)